MEKKNKNILLNFCKFTGFFSLSEWLTRKKLIILCYHNFSFEDEHQFKPLLHIKKNTFKKRIEYLRKKNYRFISLDGAVQKLKNNDFTDKSIVITFDDGWYSNLKHADPVLKENDIPYTIYVATEYVSQNIPIPYIIIPYFFWKTSFASSEIIKIFSTEWNTSFSGVDDLISESIRIYRQYENNYKKIEFLKKIGSILNVPAEQIIQSRVFNYLTPDEIKKMSREGVDFQLHTHSHFFPEEDFVAMNEIEENRVYIQKVTGKRAAHFCYPSGRIKSGHFNVLERQKIESAVTCLPGLNGKNTPKYLLKRFLDSEDIPWIVFQAEVSGLLPLLRRIISALKQKGDNVKT